MIAQATIRRVGAAALLGVLASGCADLGPPAGVMGYVPPAIYASWWQLTERCSGQAGDLGGVHWYVVPNSESFTLEGQSVAGAWYSVGNRIVIASAYVTDGPLVRHEMLHALLQEGGHPRHEFLGQCGDIVTCVERCLTDAGGPPDTSTTAPMVQPAQMGVATLVEPGLISTSRDSGWFTVTVSVSNPLAHAVRVAVPASRAWLGIWLKGSDGGGGESMFNSDSTVAFAPAGSAGDTRRYVFDVMPYIEGFYEMPPGSYTAHSEFMGKAAPPVPVTITR